MENAGTTKSRIPRTPEGAVLCSICGANEATTYDHLPPKGIYPKPIDNDMNLHTVPACLTCNSGGKKEDEEFKLIMGLESGQFRDNQSQLIDSLAGTIGKNKRLASQIFSNYKRVYAKYRGPIAEPVVAIEFNATAYDATISRIVRGLYWRETGEVLGLLPQIDVIPAYRLDASMAVDIKKLMDMLPAKKLNKDTFAYKWTVDDTGTSFWGMQFFGRHTTFAIAEPPVDNERPKAGDGSG